MKYAPRKVFILENDMYIELSYKEFCRRRENDKTYEDKLFIPVQGCLIETDRKNYIEFYRDRERQNYLKKLDKKVGLLSIDAFDKEDEKATDLMTSEQEDIVSVVVNKMELIKLRDSLHRLSESERELIILHFYKDIPQTELAKIYGINQSSISRRIKKILAKLKRIMEI